MNPEQRDALQRHMARNQREIMLALLRICHQDPSNGKGASAENLRVRIQLMEREYDWICPPGQKIT